MMVLTFVQKHVTEKEIAMDTSLLRKCIVEFIGTFFLVYVVGCVSQQEHVLLGPLAIGASLMVMIFAGGHISGGHYNPAVTLGVWIRGACGTVEASFYLVAQVIGAIVASIAVAFLLGHGSSPTASAVSAAPKGLGMVGATLLPANALLMTQGKAQADERHKGK